jgi:uncharacterized protein YbjT (DUF2867 family)
MILVTSAGGKTGRAMIQAFSAADRNVRALVRRDAAVDEMRDIGAVETIVADLSDRDALTRAMEGIGAVYYIAPNMSENEKIHGANMIAAAEAVGIDRFVFHSVLHTNVQALAHHWARLAVEEALIESNLAFTILQVSSYMQNMLPGWARMVETGVHAMAYDVAAPMSLVDLEDVAEAALRVIDDDGYAKGIFEIAGPVITLREKADILTRVLGRDIRAEKLPAQTAIDHARHAGVGEFGLDSMARMFAHYDDHGLVGSQKTLGWVLGRAPTDFETFARRVQ